MMDTFVSKEGMVQIRVGEVAVVMRVFFQAHHAGFAFFRVEQHGCLLHFAAVFQNLDLRFHLVINRLFQEAEGIEYSFIS